MQQWRHKRKATALLLGAVMIFAAISAQVRVVATATLTEGEAAEVTDELLEDTNTEAYPEGISGADYEAVDDTDYPLGGDEDADISDENGYWEDEIPIGWANVNTGSLPLTGNFYSLRLVSADEHMALAVISQCPECPSGNDFFAKSYNLTDWEILSPAPGWYIHYDGWYYWYVDGLHRTSDWQEDWQFHPSPSEDYEGDIYEWAYMMAHIFDNFESIHEVRFMDGHEGGILRIEGREGGILRIERLPFVIYDEITWVGFIITEDFSREINRQQIRLYAQGQLLNPLEDDAPPVILGLEGIGWAREAATFIVARDLMNMYVCPETNEPIVFNPSGRATRGDVLAAAVKALGLTAPDVLSREHVPFDDVPLYGRGIYIDTAKRLGLVAGVGNNQFAPDRTISRQDMMTMLYNILLAMGQIEPDFELTALGRFRDIGDIADYARLPIASLARTGIIAGDGVNINPRGYMTRVEAAVFVWNLYRMGRE